MRQALDALLLLLAYVLQTAVFPFISLFGIKPDLVMIAVIALGATQGAMTGAISGLSLGLAMDLQFAPMIGFYTLPYLCAGALAGLANGRERLDRILFPTVTAAVLCFTKEIWSVAIVYLMRVDIHWGTSLIKILLSCMFTAAVMLPLYQGFYALARLKWFADRRAKLFGE